MRSPERKNILLAVDGSNESISTVTYVARMMPPTKTVVTLFHVFSKVPEAFWDVDKKRETDIWMDKIQALEKEHRETVKAFMEVARQTFLKNHFREEFIQTKVRNKVRGIARDIIAESRKDYDMLVMGSRGTGPMNGVPMGSVANKVIGNVSDRPICVVAGNPNVHQIIVAMDGSESAMRAVKYLCSTLNGRKRAVTLFHAMRRIGFPMSSVVNVDPFKEIEKAVWDDTRKMIEPAMEKARAQLLATGFDEADIVFKIVSGVPSRANALMDEAGKSDGGSIFVGRTGISQVEDFNIGRVCQKVLHRSKDTAVWVVP